MNKTILILLALVVIVLAAIFFVSQTATAEAQKTEISKILSKNGVNTGAVFLLDEFYKLNDSQLAGIKKELSGQKTFFFMPKNAESQKLADDTIAIIDLVVIEKKLSKLNEEISQTIFLETCASLIKLKERNDIELQFISVIQKNNSQSEQLYDLEKEHKIHSDSYDSLKKECESK